MAHTQRSRPQYFFVLFSLLVLLVLPSIAAGPFGPGRAGSLLGLVVPVLAVGAELLRVARFCHRCGAALPVAGGSG